MASGVANLATMKTNGRTICVTWQPTRRTPGVSGQPAVHAAVLAWSTQCRTGLSDMAHDQNIADEPRDLAEVGDEVVYNGDHNNLVRGFVAERAISPLSRTTRYR